ncbi:testicular haploid expressed protein [Biomphalaria pfeifferi]|uniref:Testicular haploid expressed protein n=1 Tax=Biomphalaria pfeifferi TaxID=112525 RepID=A0AAD8BEH3_BIOPF|nr:testicular haploid expressed protein [Biomphalaria pfeifferi]
MDNTREFEEYGEENGNTKNNDEFDRIRTKGRERFKYLAKHKEPKVEWYTCIGPPQNWGTQEPLWPLNKATISANASHRIAELATPKKNFQTGVYINRPLWQYSCGRASVLTTVDENALNAHASSRVEQLANSKTYPLHTPNRIEFVYSCGRSSPIWSVPNSALNSTATPRVLNLSQHKPYHPRFQPEKSLPWEVPEPAKKAKASERVEQLASPKARPEGPFREPTWQITERALKSVASPRCLELARSKSLVEGFLPAKDIEWPVSRAAKQASASERITALSQPIQRMNMNILQFNPEAFKVKPQALKGQIPARVNELAQPINR